MLITFITEQERAEAAKAGKAAACEFLSSVADEGITNGERYRCAMKAYKACHEAILDNLAKYNHRYVLGHHRDGHCIEDAKSSDTPDGAFLYQADEDVDHAFAGAYYESAFDYFADGVAPLSEAGWRFLPMIQAAKVFGCLSMADSAIGLASDGESLRAVSSACIGDIKHD